MIDEKKKKGEKDVSVLLLFIFRYCLFPLGDVHLGQRICLRGDTQGFIINMGVDLRGIQVVMSQTSWTARTSTPFCSISVAAVCRSL